MKLPTLIVGGMCDNGRHGAVPASTTQAARAAAAPAPIDSPRGLATRMTGHWYEPRPPLVCPEAGGEVELMATPEHAPTHADVVVHDVSFCAVRFRVVHAADSGRLLAPWDDPSNRDLGHWARLQVFGTVAYPENPS